jgi:hypothetical protein
MIDAAAARVRRAHCGSEGALIAAHWPVTDELPSRCARAGTCRGRAATRRADSRDLRILFAMD